MPTNGFSKNFELWRFSRHKFSREQKDEEANTPNMGLSSGDLFRREMVIPMGHILAPMILLAFVGGFVIGRWIRFGSNRGEALVANAIATGFGTPHVLLNNVTLQCGGESTQIDHVLVAETGIFVIETKHYSGWIFGRPGDSHWTQVIHRRKSKFQNPIRQNHGHVTALRVLVTLPGERFIPVVVFTGDAEFKSDLGPSVLKLNQLVSNLSAERPRVFDERMMTYIVGRIEMKRMRRSLETDEYHLNSVRRRMAAKALT